MAPIEGSSLRQAVQFAITTEQIGAEAYRRFARKLGDQPEVAQVFAQLAEDEERHEAEFRAIMESVPDHDAVPGYAEKYGYLKAMSISEFFSPRAGLTRDAEDITTREDALFRGIELEKASIAYYQALREVLGASEALDAILAAERQHLLKLAGMLDQAD
ncbi:MAG: hypothetical protein LJE95_12705 [Acidobacteria bacterium]|jgi:rubrerythrin|nr:hypothetical protein [Acidobacteriota bacterium]